MNYNILYKGRKIYQNLPAEDCIQILEDFADSFYEGEDIDPNEVEMEEILNGEETITHE